MSRRNRVYRGDNRNVYVAGDLHGDYRSFRGVLSGSGGGGDSVLIFLGDYADRGPRGLEIITELSRLLGVRRDIVALKGNHEMYIDKKPVFSPCDLVSEADAKYSSWEAFYGDVMEDFLSRLYIAAVINDVLFVHAGISSGIRKQEDLEDPKNETDLLWSDPSAQPGQHPNPRGAGVTFGEDVTGKVLASLGMKLVVRSHEPHKAAYGPCSEHSGRVITVNSCSSYGESWRPFLLRIDTVKMNYEPVFLN